MKQSARVRASAEKYWRVADGTALFKVRRGVRGCLPAVRREIARLAAIVEQRTAEAEKLPRAGTFRPLSEAETAAVLGAELLAQVAASTTRA